MIVKFILKYLIILILLFTGKSFAAEYYTNENGKLIEYGTIVIDYVTEDGKKISYGTVINSQKVLVAGPSPGTEEYWKRRDYRKKKEIREALEREIKENKVPYPVGLDEKKLPPPYKTIYNKIWHGCCTSHLSDEDKIIMINDYMTYYKKLYERRNELKSWEYFDRKGVLMVRTPKGKVYNAELIKWGLSLGVIQHNLKNKKTSSVLIVLPSCSRFKKYK